MSDCGALLFDLDGTLLDTAPDMVACLHELQDEEQQAPLPYLQARAHVSHGSLGLLRVAFGELADAERERLQRRFLAMYASRLMVKTALFEGMTEVLAAVERARIPWGIVTNKPGYLTEPLLQQLNLRSRCACVVSGDTIAQRKPHPQPLLHAVSLIPALAKRAIYVGDAERDIVAGKAAGMRTVAALYGYIPANEDPAGWGADHHISDPAGLFDILALSGSTSSSA